MRKLWIILVLSGLLLASYPFLDRAYTWYLQMRIFTELYSNKDTVQEEVDPSEYIGLHEIFEEAQENADYNPIQSLEPALEPEPDPSEAPAPNRRNAIGVLTIDRINLRLPIVYGVSRSNLKAGAGQITGTTKLGAVGNAALAAHRSHTFGRLFNRLDELEIGDQIRVKTDDGTFVYVVYKKHLVEPSDMSVLWKNNRDRVITLITCDPPDTATHRLIVHGVLSE